jgi:hypothetical protein
VTAVTFLDFPLHLIALQKKVKFPGLFVSFNSPALSSPRSRANMSLRRPPTRIELKSEDISEYEELKNERLMEQADTKSNLGNMLAQKSAPQVLKKKAAERIGMNKRR